jgi:hypothetical protein
MRLHSLLLSLVVSTAAAAVPVTSRAADGAILIDGQRFFPVGFYHVTANGTTTQAAADQKTADLTAMADSGCTAMHPIVSTDDVGWPAFLTLAGSRNVKLVAHVPWNVLTYNVNAMKSYPAIFSWNIGDDINWVSGGVNGANFQTPAQLATRHNQVRALDPSRLTFAAAIGAPSLALATYAGSVDIIGIESYPIGNEANSVALESNATFYAYAQSSLGGTATTWMALPQTFAWTGQAYPTGDEYRNLVYAGLVKGARGVLNYTYYDDGGLLPVNAPALWTACQAVQGELANLLTAIRDGTRSELSTGVANIHAATWTLGSQVTVVVLNTHRTLTRTVNLAMPAGCTGPAQAVFAGRPSGLGFAGGFLTGSVQPDAVHVYRLSLNQPPVISQVATAAPSVLSLP